MLRSSLALPGLMVLLTVTAFSQPRSPQSVVEELLAADRGFAAEGRMSPLAEALAAMFAEDVMMPLPSGRFAQGRAEAIRALAENPLNTTSTAEWTPVRGGVAADGLHGFTFGYLTLHRADGTSVPAKYLGYWIKQSAGWRVAVYKRGPGAGGVLSLEAMPPSLPSHLVAPASEAAAIERARLSLERAEQAFSDEAQKIGLGPAFAKYGSADAVNMGGPQALHFVVGAEAIGRAIGAGATGSPGTVSPVRWSADRVIVASSGDLGVTLGMIRRNTPPPDGQPAATPFVTIWRRARLSDPWRYIAE